MSRSSVIRWVKQLLFQLFPRWSQRCRPSVPRRLHRSPQLIQRFHPPVPQASASTPATHTTVPQASASTPATHTTVPLSGPPGVGLDACNPYSDPAPRSPVPQASTPDACNPYNGPVLRSPRRRPRRLQPIQRSRSPVPQASVPTPATHTTVPLPDPQAPRPMHEPYNGLDARLKS